MKLIVELPDWCEERDISIIAGAEAVAYKPAWSKEMLVKTGRCNKCGLCCHKLDPSYPIEKDENMTCVHMKKMGREDVWECQIWGRRPYGCVWSDPILTKSYLKDKCSISYKVGGKQE